MAGSCPAQSCCSQAQPEIDQSSLSLICYSSHVGRRQNCLTCTVIFKERRLCTSLKEGSGFLKLLLADSEHG